MVLGLGTDIIEISRIEKLLENKRFLNRVFSEEEQTYIFSKKRPGMTAAGIFCAKEAVFKAAGDFISGLGFNNIIIGRSETGKPIVFKISGKEVKPGVKYELSISHTDTYATSVAIAFTE